MDNIRALAKKIENQNIYVACKEIPTLKLFNNDKDLSKLQCIYLSYLIFYYNLNMEVALKKVSKKVFDNEIFEDAYSIYKQNKKEDIPKNKKDRDIHLVFPRKNKKRK